MALDKEAYFKMIGYKPHPKQRLYHDSKARFRIPSCGRRFGKTTMVARDKAAELLIPQKSQAWIVGPSYSLGEKEFRVIWDDLMIGQKLGKDKRVKRAYNLRTGDMFIEMPWGTRLEVKSAAHPELLVGEGLKWVIMSEAAKHNVETWERYIRPALADERGSADFPSTPEGRNWYYKLWMEGKTQDNYDSWKFPSWENPVVYPGGRNDPEMLEIERSTTPDFFGQEYGADFRSFVGRIFAEFDEDIHVQPHEFRPEWPNYMAFDWGYVNPLAAVEYQVSPQDDIYVWREHYKSYMTLPQHIAELKARPNPEGYHLDLCFGDAADPEAVAQVTQDFHLCIADPNSKTNWREGIDQMLKLVNPMHDGLSYDEYERPILRPKYFVDPSCTNHIHEMGNYRAKDRPETKKESNEAGAAKKEDDHTVDAMRYALVHNYILGYQADADYSSFFEFDQPVRERIVVDEVPDPGYGVGTGGRVTQGMRF